MDEYTHDPIDQLVRVRYQVTGGVPVRDVQYQYDLVGNRQVVTDNGVPVAYTVNNMNQYTTVGGEPLSYDANGNLTGMPELSLQYDSWNRLISAATESNVVLFAYDGRHRCVKRVEIQNGLGRTTIMIWDHEPSQGWGLLEERGPNGKLLARHVHGPSVDDLVLSELSGVVYYYHHDHLSSTIAVTDESGRVVEQYRYDVYGQPYFFGPDGAPRSESALGVRFLFTGREWLGSVGLYDYRHRAYSPSLGRFLQLDPLGWNGRNFNLLTYAANSPAWLRDLFGLAVYNRSSRIIWVKPEHSSEPVPVPPGGNYHGAQDGLADPEKHPGKVYKTVNHVDVIVYEDGTIYWEVEKCGWTEFVKSSWGQLIKGGWKGESWLRKLQEDKDFGWNEIFRRAGASP